MPETPQSEALIQKAEHLISLARHIHQHEPTKTHFISTYLSCAAENLIDAADAYDREAR